ncbi:MAG TPA: YhcH/YjgK/YiaL family protein [Puia sp.]
MKILSVKSVSFFAAFLIFSLGARSQKTMTRDQAIQWMKSGVWKHGLQKKPHASIDPQEFAEQYQRNPAIWDKAFAFLNRKDLDTLSPGNYPLDGDRVYGIVSVYDSKDMDKTKWESHRKYIDLQYVIKGKEKIGVAPVSKAKVTEPYDESKDIAHYESDGKYYLAQPGVFFLFFPQETHRPGIKVEGSVPVRKLVIKIRVAGT